MNEHKPCCCATPQPEQNMQQLIGSIAQLVQTQMALTAAISQLAAAVADSFEEMIDLTDIDAPKRQSATYLNGKPR